MTIVRSHMRKTKRKISRIRRHHRKKLFNGTAYVESAIIFSIKAKNKKKAMKKLRENFWFNIENDLVEPVFVDLKSIDLEERIC